jgi:Tol biopolymer transport system component
LQGLDFGADLWAPQLAADARTLMFSASLESEDLLFAVRAEVGVDFANPFPLVAVNSASADGTPFLSADGLRLYFFSTRNNPDGGGRDLWLASRVDLNSQFSELRPLSELNTPSEEQLPWLSEDELTIVFASTRPAELADFNLLQATRTRREAPFDPPQLLANVNSDGLEGRGSLSRDGLTIVLSSTRAGGAGADDLWVAQRASLEGPFGEPVNLVALNSPARDMDVALSPDGLELFFVSLRGGPSELWRSVRPACTP